MSEAPNLEGTDWRSSGHLQEQYVVTSSFTRGRDTNTASLSHTSSSSSSSSADATSNFRMPLRPNDHLLSGPDGGWVHPGAVLPVRGYSGTADMDDDWPAYDPWTGLRTAGVLGGCMLLVLVYILYKTRCGGRAGRPRRRWTSKDRLFVEKYKRKVQERCGPRSAAGSTRRGAVASLADAVHLNHTTIVTNAADRKRTSTMDAVTSSNTATVDINIIPGSDTRLHDDEELNRARRNHSTLSIGGGNSTLTSRLPIRPSSADPLIVSTTCTSGERTSNRSVSVGAALGLLPARDASTMHGGRVGDRGSMSGPSSMSPVVLLFDCSSTTSIT